MGMTRRRLTVGAAALAMPFVARAQGSSTITVAAPGGLFQHIFQAALINGFRRTRPATTVRYHAVSNPAQILGLLRQRLVPAEYDVVLLNPRIATQATKEGLVAPLTVDGVPALADLVPAARPPDIGGAIAMVDCLSIPHAPIASGTALTSWRALWDGAAAQRIAIPAPPDPIGIGLTLIASQLFGGGHDREPVKGGVAALSHLAPRVVSWNPKPDVYDYLIDGHAAVGVAWNGLGQARATREPSRLGVTVPREIPVRDVITIHMAAASGQSAAARAFINHVLGAEGQARIADSLFMTPVNARIRIPTDIAHRLIPLDDPTHPIQGIDAPAIDSLRSAIVSGWRAQVMRPK